MQTTQRALAALLATTLVLGAAPLALAGGHMSLYVLTPEHDDAGRSAEPTFDGVTTALGVAVGERSVDATLDGVGEAHTGDIAPGCSSDAGRQASGLCFLFLQTGGVAGVGGMSGSAAPGTLDGVQLTKGRQLRILDLQATFQVVRAYVEVNKKLDDSGARTLLGGIDPNFGSQVMMPANGATMWSGLFQDKNGNGVIDAEGSGDFNAAQQARNELTWEGQCRTFTGGDSQVPPWVCSLRTPADVYVWAFPGNHHASTFGANGLFLPTDAPGMQAVCFVNAATFNVASGTAGLSSCPGRIQDIEENDDTFDIGAGDVLLGEQGSIKPDFSMAHRTGDANPNTRHMVAGLGWAMYHYDQSLLVSYTTVASLNPPPDVSGRLFNPAQGQLVDVDRYATFSPQAEALLAGTVKPTARTQWLVVRDGYIPANNLVDGTVNNHNTGLGAVNPVQGVADDAALDPGFSHEPNHPGDSYPFVVRGAASHAGAFHNYAGYRSLRTDGVGHLFGDAQLFRTTPLIRPGMPADLPPPPVPAGPFLVDSLSPTPARSPGDHRRSLSPGLYDVLGGLGAWQDKTQVNVEEVLGSGETRYESGPDGWVGNVVNTTGQFRYRGYLPENCVVNGVAGTYEYAQCHPHSDGVLSQPNDFGTDDGEMIRGCGGIGSQVGTFRVTPLSGTWTFPVFVFRGIEEWTVGNTSAVQDFTGTSQAIVLTVTCAQANLINARDYLVLPLGNLGGDVRTTWTAQASTVAGETIVDVDDYVAFG